MLKAVQDDRIFCGASLAITHHICPWGVLQHLRSTGHRTSRVELLAVEHAHCLRHQQNIFAGGHGCGLGVYSSTNDHAVVQFGTLSVAVMLPCVAGETCSEYDSNPDFSMDMTNGPLDAVLKSKVPSAPVVV